MQTAIAIAIDVANSRFGIPSQNAILIPPELQQYRKLLVVSTRLNFSGTKTTPAKWPPRLYSTPQDTQSPCFLMFTAFVTGQSKSLLTVIASRLRISRLGRSTDAPT
jgi:hypothetical protein